MKHVYRHQPYGGDVLLYSHEDLQKCLAYIATLLPDVQERCYVEDDDDYRAAELAEWAAHSHTWEAR